VATEISHLAFGDLTRHSIVMLDQARKICGVAVSARQILVREPGPASTQQSLQPRPLISNYIFRHRQYSSQVQPDAATRILRR
jgi:hypothetical protein